MVLAMCRGGIEDILGIDDGAAGRRKGRPQRSFMDLVKENMQRVVVTEEGEIEANEREGEEEEKGSNMRLYRSA